MAVQFNNDDAWKPVKVGAGGWLTGIDIAQDGTKVVRADTYGAYLWNGSKWVELITVGSMPADVMAGGGVYEIRIAPNNSNILYMQTNGTIYKSINQGGTWTKTNFPTVYQDSNSANRMDGQKMAIDPTNPNVVFAGTQHDGLFVTHDGGQSWQSVTGVPRGADAGTSPDPALTGIVFDPSGGMVNGVTKVIYAGTAGSGVYRSSDGGTTWTALAGGPKDVSNAALGSDGSYYATGNTDLSLWKYTNGAWAKLISSQQLHAVAVDPFNPAHVIAMQDGGSINESHDGGVTWTGWNWATSLNANNDVPWLADSGAYMSTGGIMFDPHTPGKLWQSAGVGVWQTDLPSTINWNTPIVWHSQSVGIEQLVANDIIAPAGADPVMASWDRPFFDMANPDAYATSYSGGHFSMGWSVDYASSNTTFLVGISDWWGTEDSGFSTDGGKTWNKFTGLPSFAMNSVGGSIAASTPMNIIWAPAGNFAPAYTTDGGVSWKSISLPGKTDWNGFDFAYYLDRTTVTADRVLPNTFYLYDVASGVYQTHDGGANWTQVYRGELTAWSQFNAKIEAAPGRAAELFFTGGAQDAGSATQPADEAFMHSLDGGATWTAVAGVKEVSTFGYGAPATPEGPATVFIVGWVNGEYGVFYSTDDAQSWTQIGRYPLGSLDSIRTISGDMDQYGRVYVGFAGSGYAYLDIASSAPTSFVVPTSHFTGGAGVDVMHGTAGADLMSGGDGSDIYEVNHVGDVVFEQPGQGTDQVFSYVDFTLPDNVEHLSMNYGSQTYGYGNALDNIIVGNDAANVIEGRGGNDNVLGGGGDDHVDGGSGNDYLSGGDGNDVLLGGTGSDVMIGGAGSDMYEVDHLADIVWETPGQGTADTVYAYIDFTLPVNVENLIMTYGHQTYGLGNDGDNIIVGNDQSNVIEGRGGYDTLTGGGGSDYFVVNPNFGVDVITDFVAGGGTPDAVIFSRSIFTSFQDVMSHSRQVGPDTWIGDGHGNTVVLSNVQLTTLHPDDFGFV